MSGQIKTKQHSLEWKEAHPGLFYLEKKEAIRLFVTALNEAIKKDALIEVADDSPMSSLPI